MIKLSVRVSTTRHIIHAFTSSYLVWVGLFAKRHSMYNEQLRYHTPWRTHTRRLYDWHRNAVSFWIDDVVRCRCHKRCRSRRHTPVTVRHGHIRMSMCMTTHTQPCHIRNWNNAQYMSDMRRRPCYLSRVEFFCHSAILSRRMWKQYTVRRRYIWYTYPIIISIRGLSTLITLSPLLSNSRRYDVWYRYACHTRPFVHWSYIRRSAVHPQLVTREPAYAATTPRLATRMQPRAWFDWCYQSMHLALYMWVYWLTMSMIRTIHITTIFHYRHPPTTTCWRPHTNNDNCWNHVF